MTYIEERVERIHKIKDLLNANKNKTMQTWGFEMLLQEFNFIDDILFIQSNSRVLEDVFRSKLAECRKRCFEERNPDRIGLFTELCDTLLFIYKEMLR